MSGVDSYVIVCPHCGGLNRAPAARLTARQTPDCGRCHQPLFTGKPVDLADASAFDRMISRTEIPVVVDFWAGWCAPCRQMAPHFAAASAELEPLVRFAKLDTEAAPDVSARFGIRGIPCMIMFRKGKEVARQAGALDKRAIVAFITGAS